MYQSIYSPSEAKFRLFNHAIYVYSWVQTAPEWQQQPAKFMYVFTQPVIILITRT
jgi:hypothetical protein